MLGYRFATEELALRIGHERYPPVEVELEPWSFVVRVVGREARFGICEADLLASHVLAELERERRAGVKKLPLWLVGGHLLGLRDRGLPRVNPAAAEVLRRVLAVGRRAPRLAGVPALYDETYVVRDVLRYRAAAIALAFLESDLLGDWLRTRGPRPDARPHDGTRADAWEPALAALRDWRALFSPDGRTYRSLDRTLMNLPSGVPAKLVCALRRVRLERPLTGRASLAALLLFLTDRRRGRNGDAAADHATIFLRATDADVARACEALGRHTEQTLDPRRTRGLRTLVAFVLDCPERYQGDLPGLVRRAIRWHVQRALRQARVAESRTRAAAAARHRALAPWQIPVPAGPRPRPAYDFVPPPPARFRHERATARPPIPLPRHAGITFLARVGAIDAEGERMEHCIADYAREAVDGECYLFHVSHAGCEASVEVDRHGYVRQASGPRNVKNAASRWGARVLGLWGRRLRWSEPDGEPAPVPPALQRPLPRAARAGAHERQLSLLLLRE